MAADAIGKARALFERRQLMERARGGVREDAMADEKIVLSVDEEQWQG